MLMATTATFLGFLNILLLKFFWAGSSLGNWDAKTKCENSSCGGQTRSGTIPPSFVMLIPHIFSGGVGEIICPGTHDVFFFLVKKTRPQGPLFKIRKSGKGIVVSVWERAFSRLDADFLSFLGQQSIACSLQQSDGKSGHGMTLSEG